ncbi:hypothetical protein F5Y18DRAFT_431486 [Xylariaceae sp. FL1019]|nr:hypothetical protein F5Y18DRAFT_431486 [Xylariaceae sp. FL1019]
MRDSSGAESYEDHHHHNTRHRLDAYLLLFRYAANLFALLGNDEEDDQPSAPVKTVDKTVPRTTKRNVEPQAPAKPAGATGGARRGPGGNEGAFRDRNVGTTSNQRKTTDEPSRGGPRGGRGARREGGRGGRFPRERDDRHTKGQAGTGSEKQAAQSWGATEGEAEQKDEQAGEAIAQSELKEAAAEDAEDATPAEPEDKSVSYTDYLAQQAEKKLALGESLELRKANEGSKTDKKWANAKAITKDEDDDLFSATAAKTKRERERKVKQVVDIDQRYVEPDRPARGGARGGPRGGSGRGGPRGDGPRGRGGEGRGGRGRGDGFRGGRPAGPTGPTGGRDSASINTKDESAFPILGA